MLHPSKLVLIGLRLSGKSTLGRIVAQRLGFEFIDLDDAVLKKLGRQNVTETFRAIGEPAWRAAECGELERLLAQDQNCVLALGGGTPMAPGAVALLTRARHKPMVALLDPGEEELVRRLAQHRGDRPPLPGIATTGDAQADAAAEVHELRKIRMPLYRSLAHVIVDTSAGEQACAGQIQAAWQKSGAA